jgi:hypothetical protein
VTFTTFIVLPRLLLIATLCFAAAIPILAVCIYLLENKIKAMRAYIALQVAGSILALGGLLSVFLHLNIWAGIIFGVISAGMLAAADLAIDKTAS